MTRRIPLAIRIGLLSLTTLFVLYCASNMLLFGRVFPVSHVDKLDHPVSVTGWDGDGLVLSDGRHVLPKGMEKLPKDSATLQIATSRGVEVAMDGRIFGLLELWHWCGNDPVKYDLQKIDLAQLLAYHQEGQSYLKPFSHADHSFVESGGGDEHGWSVSRYRRMKMMFDPKFAKIFAR